MAGILTSTLNHSVMITLFVLLMMLVIEYINVQSKNKWSRKFQNSPIMQIIIAGLLGILPGCLGAFTVVSLYTHRMIGFAGLVTVMIATSGDEAFVMFAMMPGKALVLQGVIFILSIIAGLAVHWLARNKLMQSSQKFIIHEHEHCQCFIKNSILPQLKNITFERALLLVSTILFIVLLVLGVIGNIEWNWKKITFLLGGMFLLFVFITVPDHFLKDHLYKHILKKHLLRIFLWTWGAFIVLHFIQTNFILNNILQNNVYLILLIAVLVGIIPESGPHLIFVTLFSQNLIPFSILLANSIVQDGHAMLPLFAESGKDFLKVKIINMVVGLIAGLIMLQFNV